LGNFVVIKKNARKGRNPQTGDEGKETIAIHLRNALMARALAELLLNSG
jgi:nucleoid DNA-binding protein